MMQGRVRSNQVPPPYDMIYIYIYNITCFVPLLHNHDHQHVQHSIAQHSDRHSVLSSFLGMGMSPWAIHIRDVCWPRTNGTNGIFTQNMNALIECMTTSRALRISEPKKKNDMAASIYHSTVHGQFRFRR